MSVVLFKSWNNLRQEGYRSNNWAIFQLQRLAPEVCSRNTSAHGMIKLSELGKKKTSGTLGKLSKKLGSACTARF